jgi:ABC-type transport system involved in multi-copper enzyme maturation permease subunit
MSKTLRSYVFPSVIYFLMLEVGLAAAILFWPEFEKNAGMLKAMAPISMLKDMVDQLAQGGIEAYVVGQHFFKGCNTLGTAAAVLLAAGAVAGEVQRGTFELWIARPFSRRRLLFERWFIGALALTLPIFLSTASVPWLLGYVGAEIELGPLMWAAVHQSVFLLCTYSLTFFLSTLFDSPMGITLGVLFFTTLQFSIYLIKVATHWSLFRLADIQVFMDIMKQGQLDLRMILPLIGMTVLFLWGASVRFSRQVP